MSNITKQYEPVVEVTFDRENFESYLDVEVDFSLTENQWLAIYNDLERSLWESLEVIIAKAVADYASGVYDNPTPPTTPERITL
jgi:hypothetical protein